MIYKPTRREVLKYAGVGALAFGVPLLLKVKEAYAVVTYFGYCNSDGTLTGGAPSTDNPGASQGWWNDTQVFTCPGTGNQDVQSMEIQCFSNGSATARVNIAVYSLNGLTRLAYGTADIGAAFTPTTFAWQGYTSPAQITQSAALVGGTTYKLYAQSVIGTDNITLGYYSGAANATGYHTSATTGAPSAIPSKDANYSLQYPLIRIGVQPTGGGGGASAIMHRRIQ